MTTPPRPPAARLLRGLGLAFYLLCALLAALYLAWMAQARAGFLYPFWYEVIGIDQTIEQYAPKNRNRRHFQLTDKAEHIRLFDEMAHGIRSENADFAEIQYHAPDGRRLGQLLTTAEIAHLQDVARLVTVLERLGRGALAAWLTLSVILLWRRGSLPGLRHQLLAATGGLAAAMVIVLAIGPTRVFYQLHTWVFPSDSQWFFYYEDSLMSTLMQAPNLFGGIAAALLLTALPLWLLLLWLPVWLERRRAARCVTLAPRN